MSTVYGRCWSRPELGMYPGPGSAGRPGKRTPFVCVRSTLVRARASNGARAAGHTGNARVLSLGSLAHSHTGQLSWRIVPR